MQVIGYIQFLILFGLSAIALGLSLWALLDAAVRPAAAFLSADKRSKGIWLAITAGATLVSFLSIPGVGGGGFFFLILGGVAAGVYLADVRPAVRESGNGGSAW